MANYRMLKETETLRKLMLGREHIGWCRQFPGGAWEAKSKFGRGVGPTAGEAFTAMVRESNNAVARREGYGSAREMMDAQNAQVQQQADEMNQMFRDAGLPMRMKVRSRGRVVV